MSQSAITLSFPEEDIALLSLDMPGKGANILSVPLLEEFGARLDEVEQRDGVAGLIIASGPRSNAQRRQIRDAGPSGIAQVASR